MLEKIAARHNKRLAQIVLRWAVQKGVGPMPSSIQTNHIKANLDIQDFHFSECEMSVIDGLGEWYQPRDIGLTEGPLNPNPHTRSASAMVV
ncbi:MAG: aldo/keto reductase [Acidobacteria bacterium]|nr:aldo/keto reductase [Acidobacteriota bacterium]